MMNFLYKILLAFNATYLIVVVFLYNKGYFLIALEGYPKYYSWLIFFAFPVLLTGLSFLLCYALPKDQLKSTSIDEIELANNSFLPTYLGYFFVSLGITEIPVLIAVFSIIYVFTCLSQTLYFNPIFLLFGYHFYFIKTSQNIKIFLITRKQLKSPKSVGFDNLRRINNYTFIEF